jgi:large subunit ribosomal protein L6|tara:strand:- start:3403 stop:3939 length:537 start_codon:yes stop_codon:yes gene_type:complete
MKKEIFQTIEIPKGVEAEINGNTLIINGPEGENKKTFNTNKLVFEKKENSIIIGSKKATKTEKRMINTITAHINNMVKGVQEKFEYKLKICFSHFPFSIEIKGDEAIIKNFLGEKIPRKLKISGEVDINKDIITIKSVDKELAGQIAANFEQATRIKSKDKRVFQDGCYIISKDGRGV